MNLNIHQIEIYRNIFAAPFYYIFRIFFGCCGLFSLRVCVCRFHNIFLLLAVTLKRYAYCCCGRGFIAGAPVLPFCRCIFHVFFCLSYYYYDSVKSQNMYFSRMSVLRCVRRTEYVNVSVTHMKQLFLFRTRTYALLAYCLLAYCIRSDLTILQFFSGSFSVTIRGSRQFRR